MKKIETLKWAASLKNLRRIIGATQPEFAELIGASTILIKFIESGRRDVTRKLGTMIQMATGATIGGEDITTKGLGLYTPCLDNTILAIDVRYDAKGTPSVRSMEPFALKHFRAHRATRSLDQVDEYMARTLTILFKASSRVETGKLHGLRWSFMEWVDEAIKRFKLPVTSPLAMPLPIRPMRDASKSSHSRRPRASR